MPDYIYIDPSGNMLDSNHQDTPQAAITCARMLAAMHQVAWVCAAKVLQYKVKANICSTCNQFFSEDVYDELWPTCPACDRKEEEQEGIITINLNTEDYFDFKGDTECLTS